MRNVITKAIAVSMLALLMLSFASLAGAQQGIVSTEWLQANLSKVLVVDMRKVEDYSAGHIPGSINIFYGTWAVQRRGLLNELPADDDLRDVLTSAGIEPTSNVVVVGRVDSIPEKANITRVAWTLNYAGVENVAVLDGGFDKWVADKKPVSKDAAKPKSKGYKGKFNKDLLVDTAYVLANLGKAVIVDTREAPFFSGEKKLDFVARPGHVKGAVNLPSMAVYNADGTFKVRGDLETMAKKAAPDLSKEVIVYCDSGRVASIWWFLLSEGLGYKNVKLYDGSVQDFAKDASAPMESK
jgi:thiosulfate/3-mercaptopyruvate sulfurtransferase